MKRKIYIAGVWGTGNVSIMEQLKDDADVQYLKHDFKYFFKFQKIWRIVNQRLGGHGRGVIKWLLRTKLLDSAYALSHCDFAANEENIVVIFNSALHEYYSKEYFERLRRKYQNIKYVLYIIDPMPGDLWQEIRDALDVFDLVATMHPYNCKKYGFSYLPYAYVKHKTIAPVSGIKRTKLFFCGVIDDYRQAIISDLVSLCEKNNTDFDFWLKPYGNNSISSEYVHYSEMPYAENVQRLEKAECILEVMHEGYVGITQRYLEAVIYNKRLLTNNKEIKELPYYDPRYMYYFEKVEDIDWNWLCSDVAVDYHYKGDFSVQTWKENLVKLVE